MLELREALDAPRGLPRERRPERASTTRTTCGPRRWTSTSRSSTTTSARSCSRTCARRSSRTSPTPRPTSRTPPSACAQVWELFKEMEPEAHRARRDVLPRAQGPLRLARTASASTSAAAWAPRRSATCSSRSTSRPSAIELEETGQDRQGPEAGPRGQAPEGRQRVPPLRQPPGPDGARGRAGHPAGAAPDGPARRRPLRDVRPQRPLPPRHQPQQPPQAAARPRRAGDHRQQREADAAGGRRRAVRQRPPRPARHGPGQPAR